MARSYPANVERQARGGTGLPGGLSHAWRLCAFALFAFFCGNPLCAADKSGVSPNTISLPKGPGSVEGLGESFQPTLNTGTAKYSVRLTVPPGVAGQTPELALGYEGGGGNGPLGFGWSLSLPAIQRRCDNGIPTYGEDVGFARQDFFINERREELVPATTGFYFCKNESGFVRYRQVSGHWEGTLPDGTRQEFGLTEAGRVQENTNRVFSWLLERETDTRGNVIAYFYEPFPGATNLNQQYISAIRYGPGAPPWDNYHFVVFNYEDRADWFEDCRPGFPVRTGKRLKSIVVGTHGPVLVGHAQGDFDGDGLTDNLVRRYDLDYVAYAGTNSHWSLLGSIRVVGADGMTSLPPSTFGYAISNPPDTLSAENAWIGGANEPPWVMDNPSADFVDLNGDGLPDILKTEYFGGQHTAFLNRGVVLANGQPAIQWLDVGGVGGDAQTWNINLASQSEIAHLADMDGDGLADLVFNAGFGEVYYFSNRAKVAWGNQAFMSILDFAPPAPFGNPSVRTADVDFDKRMDVIQSVDIGGGHAEYQIWFNLGGSTYSRPVPQVGGFLFGQSGVQIADFNGDRVPDVAQVTPMVVIVTPGLGYGRFGPAVRVDIPTWTLDDDQIARAKLTDINGDGLADLVIERAVPGELWFWINLGNYTFGSRRVVTGMPSGGAIRWADINGNGSTDIVFADSGSSPKLLAVDLGQLINGAPVPNMLTVISNGIGRVTLIGYEPSTKFALEDAAAGHPWPDPMPFPVQVVSSVTNLDSLGHSYVSRFRYHDGYYDPVEKQFRGFARVEQVDLGDVTAPTLVTRSHFDTGRNIEAMKGKLLQLTAEQEDGNAFWDELTVWTATNLMTGVNGTNVVYVHPSARNKVVKELGKGAERRLDSEFEFDNFGNQTLEADYGIVVNGDRSVFNDERIVSTQYAINTNAWILRTPSRQQTADETGAVISRTDYFYDDETFSGSNWGIVMIGNLTMKREWRDPSIPSAYITSTRTKYDIYGNPTTILDPLAVALGGAMDFSKGHAREIAYDGRFHAYPVTETIHIGNGSAALVFQATYDEGFGTVTSSTDFNANSTIYGYDTFARLTSIVKPGDTAQYPTAEYDYALAQSFPFPPAGQGQGEGVINYIETRQIDKPITGSPITDNRSLYLRSRQFVDGLGRKLLSKTEAEPAPGSTAPRVVVTEAAQFDARQKPARVLNPFFSLQGGSLDDLLAFENIEAPGWQGQFHNEGSLVTLDLASAHASRTDYDATLRPIQVTNPDGTFRRTVYEPLVTKSLDENDTDPTSQYTNTPLLHYSDGLGRLIQVDEVTKLNDDGTPAGALRDWSTRYEYDLNDQLTRITDSQNNVKTFAYDGLKRKTDMNDPDRGVMHFVYDDASNLTETTDAKAQRITYTYDGANRIRSEKYHDGLSLPPWRPLATRHSPLATDSVVYHYDEPFRNLPQGDNTLATAQNVKGALAWVEDLSGEEHTSYDSRGRVESVVKRIPDPQFLSLSAPGGEGRGEVALVSYATRFAYDSLDRLTNLTYPDADQLRYEYNDRNLLQRIPGGPSGRVIAGIAYQPSAQMGQIDYGNGVRTTYAYDSRLRLKNLLTVSQPSTLNQQLINFAYDFDGVSNIKTISDLRPGAAVPEGDPRRNTQLFQYDDLYRLTRVQYSFALPGTAARNDGEINYRYDRIGNMLAQTSTLTNHVEKGLPVADLGEMDSGGPAGRWNRTGRAANDPPGPHALTAIRHSPLATRHYPYDANGNMTNIDGLVCTWDFKDRLVAVENNEMRAAYAYDYTDRRILKDVAYKPGSANFTNNDSRITALYINKYFEVREHDAPTKYVWNGNTRVARVTGSLNTNVRVQRLRLWPGWNLCSLAVTAPNALQQLSDAQPSTIDAHLARKWDRDTQDWVPIGINDTLPAGAVLWLQAPTNTTLTITGTYADPTNRTVTASDDFLPSAGLEAWNILSAISNQPSATLWAYDAPFNRWLSGLPPPLELSSDLPAFIAPGEAVFVRADAPAQLEVPDSALRIRYYHQDHLGSSAVLSDALGNAVEGSVFYPFGQPRNHTDLPRSNEHFQFTQKERDAESGLQYFEARFLATSLGRFTRVEPLVANLSIPWLRSPQQFNSYAYCKDNPLFFNDPTGQETEINRNIKCGFSAKYLGFGEAANIAFVEGGTVGDESSDHRRVDIKVTHLFISGSLSFGKDDGKGFFKIGVGLGPVSGTVKPFSFRSLSVLEWKKNTSLVVDLKEWGVWAGPFGAGASASLEMEGLEEPKLTASGQFSLLEVVKSAPLFETFFKAKNQQGNLWKNLWREVATDGRPKDEEFKPRIELKSHLTDPFSDIPGS